jgi:ATP-binding cassette subfamily B protein
MGFFGGLTAEKYDRQYSDRELVRRIGAYFLPQRTRLIAVTILVLAIAGIGASLPVVVSRMVDLLKDVPSVQAIGVVGLILLGIAFAIWGLNWVSRSLVIRAVGDVVLQLRTTAFRAAAAHDLSFYDQFSSGRVVSRITSDSTDFGRLVVHPFYLWDHPGLSQHRTPGNTARHASHGGRELRHQGNRQRYRHRQELPAGGVHLP